MVKFRIIFWETMGLVRVMRGRGSNATSSREWCVKLRGMSIGSTIHTDVDFEMVKIKGVYNT